MTYDEMIAVIQAKRDGKQLQWRMIDGPDFWLTHTDDMTFVFSKCEYRIAPERLTVWVPVYKNGTIGGAYISECRARKAVDGLAVDRIVKCVEVTE